MEAAPNDDWCVICDQYLLKPAVLDCGHWFCCFCLKSIKYRSQENNIKCPLCRAVTDKPMYQKQKEKQVIRSVIKNPDTKVFWAQGFTINNYDKNQCKTQGFFYILRGNKLFGDIVWGVGSQHNTYNEEVGRAKGNVRLLEGGDMEYQEYGSTYSNTPREEWFGTFKNQSNGEFVLQDGRYNWCGWGRNSSGILHMKLKEITDQKALDSM